MRVENRSRSARRITGVYWSSTASTARFPGHLHGDPVELVVRHQRRIDVPGPDRRCEALIRVPHRGQVRGSESTDRLAHGDPVHRGDHIPRVADRPESGAG